MAEKTTIPRPEATIRSADLDVDALKARLEIALHDVQGPVSFVTTVDVDGSITVRPLDVVVDAHGKVLDDDSAGVSGSYYVSVDAAEIGGRESLLSSWTHNYSIPHPTTGKSVQIGFALPLHSPLRLNPLRKITGAVIGDESLPSFISGSDVLAGGVIQTSPSEGLDEWTVAELVDLQRQSNELSNSIDSTVKYVDSVCSKIWGENRGS